MSIKISQLPSDSSPTTDDVVSGVDVNTTATKKFSIANLITLIFNNIPDDTITGGKITGIDRSNLAVDSNPYKFRAYRSGNYSFATGTNRVSLNAETFDTNSNFDSTTNYRYTAPVDGFYNFNGQVRCSCSNGNVFGPAVYKNGSQYALGDLIVVGTAFDQSFNVNALIQLTAGDYVELYFVNGDAGSRTVIGTSTQTYFSGYLVSRT